MPTDLTQWITPAILVLGFLYLDRSIRSVHGELREFRDSVKQQFGDLRNHVDHQDGVLRDHMDQRFGNLRDRMGRIEGTLDVLRDFFVHKGRGTAA